MNSLSTFAENIQLLFGAKPIELAKLNLLQNEAPNIAVYALPIVLLLTIVEFTGSRISHHENYERKETISSLLIGIGNLAVNLLLKALLLYAAVWLYNLLPWRMVLNWWLLLPCFIAYDFCSYWSHRISHYCRFFWATHIVHHSAEHYNLTVAFRQSWVQHLKLVFFIPIALLGFHPLVFFVASQLSTLYQFWVHTEAIGKLHPFIEKYFGTPSNHRVHHASQDKYLDRNFGATLMIWDHLFCSFQYEEEKPVYGLTTPITNKTNPFTLNFQEYRDMWLDIRQSKGLQEMLFFLFASPANIARYKKSMMGKYIFNRSSKGNIRLKMLLAMLLLFVVQAVFAQVPTSALPTPKAKDLLFFLQQTPDANTVVYQLNYDAEGELNEHSPIKGSWIRYEENVGAKSLNAIENKLAYGVKSKPLGNDVFEIRLVAYQKLPLYLMKSVTDKTYKIYVKNGNENLLLKRVFVKVNGGSVRSPKVQYIDLFTICSKNGAEILKRINFDKS